MSNYKVISDSSCDLSEDTISENNIGIVPFYISFDDTNYLKEGIEISNFEFYGQLITHKTFPKTSLPTPQDYIDSFTPHLKEGKDILCICISSKFSGSYQSAITAMQTLREEYHTSTIQIVDSYTATACQGLTVMEAVKLLKSGKSVAEVAMLLENNKARSNLVFTVDSLEHLQKGGRIGKVAAFAATVLNIKPIINLYNGELIPSTKVRGRKKALSEVIEGIKNHTMDNPNGYNYAILKSPYNTEADNFKQQLIAELNLTDEISVSDIGITVGAHSGDTAIGVACFPKIV